jgi:hypothetical protein
MEQNFFYRLVIPVSQQGHSNVLLENVTFLAMSIVYAGYFFLIGVTGIPIVILTLANVALYSLTLAPIVWVILAEIFPNRIRGGGYVDRSNVSADWKLHVNLFLSCH